MYRHDTCICLLLATPIFIFQLLQAGHREMEARFVLSVLIIAPIAEEIIFRGFIQGVLLRKLKPISLIFITSLIFALVHLLVSGNAYSLLTFFPSLALSTHYALHKRLLAVISIHFVYNISVFC